MSVNRNTGIRETARRYILLKLKDYCRSRVAHFGHDILASDSIKREESFMQHGTTTVFAHSFNVACISIAIAYILRLRINERWTVRGALLHDYFLYDWHESSHDWHGFTHAETALRNAQRDFKIGRVESNIIIRHMFPLNIVPPRYRESAIVCIADKLSAIAETMHIRALNFN